MFAVQCSVVFSDCTFDHNLGSLYALASNLTFNGYTRMEYCAEPSKNLDSQSSIISQEGGAVTSYQSTVIFTGEINLSNNQARRGGAMLATESTIIIYQ